MGKDKAAISYEKSYKMRMVGEDGLNIVVSIPRTVIVKEARSQGLTLEEFLKQYRAIAQYNSFEGIHYVFKPIEQKAEQKEETNENSD